MDGLRATLSTCSSLLSIYFTLLTYKGIGLWDTKNKLAVNFLPWALAVLTMYSRAYLGYHTMYLAVLTKLPLHKYQKLRIVLELLQIETTLAKVIKLKPQIS
ncbi:unnamed protein product [Prunus armeniaca]